MRTTVTILTCAAALFCAAGLHAESIAVTTTTAAGSVGTQYDGGTGWCFTVADTPMKLTALGVFKVGSNGLKTEGNDVTIWEQDASGATPTWSRVILETVTSSNSTLEETGAYDTFFMLLATQDQIVLKANTSYVILSSPGLSYPGMRTCILGTSAALDGSLVYGAAFDWPGVEDGVVGAIRSNASVADVVVQNDIVWGDQNWAPSGKYASSGDIFLGPNMKLEAVPEPTTLVLLFCGVVMLFVRRK
ncbi:MAG: PEP-CTERM sorting domain-containing protein [Pirellulales bacterium]|nr:PEP-CTERM sorting domain-containing protein [Pirellulales bacterium]